MPATVITLTIPEGDVAAVVQAVCNHAGVPILAANAKPALISIVQGWAVQEARAATQVHTPTIE